MVRLHYLDVDTVFTSASLPALTSLSQTKIKECEVSLMILCGFLLVKLKPEMCEMKHNEYIGDIFMQNYEI